MGKKEFIDSTLLDKAIVFAARAHKDTERRGKGFPYIAHPLEAMAIVATMTNDQELLAAACLHDVLEDTDVTYDELKKEFGTRVADLVQAESDVVFENKSAADSWIERKQIAMDHLAHAPRDVQIVAMGDKLSNMRAMHHDYKDIGEDLWLRFHVTDPKLHEWHYRGLAEALKNLSDTEAYKEFVFLIEQTFGKKYGDFNVQKEGNIIHVFGPLGEENTLKIKDLLDINRHNILDFSQVYTINFSGIRALLSFKEEGYKFFVVNVSKKVMHRFDVTGFASIVPVTGIPKEYHLGEATQAGEGYTSTTYFTRDNDAMIKLYNEDTDIAELFREKRYSVEAFRLGIPTPLSGDIIDVEGKKGIIFERIKTKTSMARMLADDYSRLDEIAKDFAIISKELHETKCNVGAFPNVKDVYKIYVDKFNGISNLEKEKIKRFIDSVNDKDTCLHGDYHFGNVIVTADNQKLFIDMADFAYGDPLFDLGTLYFVTHNDRDNHSERLFHSPNAVLKEFYEHFVKYYYPSKSIEEVDKMLKPFAALTVIHFASKTSQKEWMADYVKELLLPVCK